MILHRCSGNASLLITGLAASLLFVQGCGTKEASHFATNRSDLPVIHAQAMKVEARKSEALEEVAGTVRPKIRATIEAKTTGRIIEFPVSTGQRVRAGDILARLDVPEVGARLESAEAALRQSERELKRISGLADLQASTRADLDSAESRYEVAKAGVAEARALLEYAQVKAPFDGVVARKHAEAGDQASPGKPLLELEDPSRMQVEANVPEVVSARIKLGEKLRIVVAGPDLPVTGEISEIAPSSDPYSRTFLVKLDLPDNVPVLSGQFARVLVPIGETSSVRVPGAAVVRRGQLEIVYTAEEGKARMRLIKTGRSADGEVEILSGLDTGSLVVVENAGTLTDGQRLQLK